MTATIQECTFKPWYVGDFKLSVETGVHPKTEKVAHFVLIETKNLFFRTPISVNKQDFYEIFGVKAFSHYNIKDEFQGLAKIFASEKNKTGYSTNKPAEDSIIQRMLQRDSDRFLDDNPFSGYLVYDKKNPDVLIGRAAIGNGYPEKMNIEKKGYYKAKNNETQCGVLIDREKDATYELYKESVFAMMVATQFFYEMNIGRSGQLVPRFTITVITKDLFSDEELVSDIGYVATKRDQALNSLGLSKMGVLGPASEDARNYDEHIRDVRGVDIDNHSLESLIADLSEGSNFEKSKKKAQGPDFLEGIYYKIKSLF